MTDAQRIGRGCRIVKAVLLGGLILGATAGATLATLLTPKETP